MAADIEAFYKRAKAFAKKGKALKGQIDVNAVGANQVTMLQIAADECDVTMAKALIQAGADLDAKDNRGTTALIGSLAAAGMEKQDPEVAWLLIDAGADIHVKKNTPIGCSDALLQGCVGEFDDIVKTLITKGVSTECLEDFIEAWSENTNELMFRAVALAKSRDTQASMAQAIPVPEKEGRGRMGAKKPPEPTAGK